MKQSKMIICAKCKTQNKADSLFCNKCFQYLTDANSASAHPDKTDTAFRPPASSTPEQPNYSGSSFIQQPRPDHLPAQSFHNMAPIEDSDAYEDVTPLPLDSPPPSPPPSSSSGKSWAVLFIGIALILGAISFLMFKNQEKVGGSPEATQKFALAEQLMQKKFNVASYAVFREFTNTFTNDPLLPAAHNNLVELSRILPPSAMQDPARYLLAKAQIAFQAQQYMVPEDGNAVRYIHEILAFDAGQNDALSMRDEIINFYRLRAQKNLDELLYQAALNDYELIDQIDPDSPDARENMEKIRQLMEQNQ